MRNAQTEDLTLLPVVWKSWRSCENSIIDCISSAQVRWNRKQLFNLLTGAPQCDILYWWISHLISGRGNAINCWLRLFSQMHLPNFQSSAAFQRINRTLPIWYIYLSATVKVSFYHLWFSFSLWNIFIF